MNWCFVYQHYVTGGLETYVLRMCKYLNNKNDSVVLVCNSVSEVMKLQYLEAGAKIEYFKEWDRKQIARKLDELIDIFISFGLSDYYLIGKYSKHALSLMYCVHPSHLTMDDRKLSFIEVLKKPVFYRIIKSGLKNNTLLMMDENISDAILNKYKLKVKPSAILRLPYEPASQVKKWAEISKKPYTVLTICRADFPFKSYVLGRVDAIESINKKRIVAELTIVSYGKDLDIIKKRISGKSYIKLIQETKYDDLENLYLSSDIYVGMGSTAIEAAKYGLPVILANVNSPDFLSCGFFCDNPQAIGEFDTDGIDGYKLLTELLKMDRDMFINLADNCKNVFDNNYDMGLFINHIRGVVKNASN